MALINKMLVGIAMVCAAFGAQASTALATRTVDLGVLSSGTTNFSSSSAFFGSAFATAGSFTDIVNFTLPNTSDSSFGAGALNFSIGTLSYLNINDLSLSLYNSNNTPLSSGLTFTVASLAAGDYHLEAAGTVSGFAGGLYAGGINVTPVPEADSYTMMIVGLGLMGFVVRRRCAV